MKKHKKDFVIPLKVLMIICREQEILRHIMFKVANHFGRCLMVKIFM
ncbi:hypothetical protein [Absiella sp. AM29-15]|nr:hypothetical protein [Absiella sp. AM29-15]